MTSCGGHLGQVDLSLYYCSANTSQNQVKLCTLKVQDDLKKMEHFRGFWLNISKTVQQIFTKRMSLLGNHLYRSF